MSSTVIITFQLTKRKGTALLWSLHITGGSSEIRTRNQRIKRSRGFSQTYIPIVLAGDKNDCAIAFFDLGY